MASRLTSESGYSIVEVLVAILILTIAILPMFKMFDVALGTTTKTRSYDLAQSLAEKQAELAQANTYPDFRDSFPDNPAKFAGISGCGAAVGTMTTSDGREVSGCKDSDSIYSNFTFSVNKRYVALPSPEEVPASDVGKLVSPSPEPASGKGLIQITISVTRNGDGSPLFTTSGVIAE